MHKGRLEAFTDAVIAIIMTIMVLELKPPHGSELRDLQPLLPKLSGYVLSFVFMAIYWNNHHHMFQAVKKINGTVLWTNTNLLFWLSLVPIGTAWMGETHFAKLPVSIYAVLLLLCGASYTILQLSLIKVHGKDSPFARALGSDSKGKLSVALYLAAVGLAWVQPLISCAIFVAVAIIWFIPDKRFEHHVLHENGED